LSPKLLLIQPTTIAADGKLNRSSRQWVLGLTLPYLAALTPDDWDVQIVDERLEPVRLQEQCDLVGISFMSQHAPRAYQLAHEFRKRQVPVVVGGFHASSLPQEALAHCDSVVVGEAENVWLDVLEDAIAGRLKPVYKATTYHDMKGLPAPRYELLKMGKYRVPVLGNIIPVQTNRGCPFNCHFCMVPQFHGKTYRFRPVNEVVDEILQVRQNFIYFVDDNFAAHRPRAIELLDAIRPLKINWAGLTNTFVGRDEELLDKMVESGCRHLNIGMESINPASLKEMNKNMNRVEDYQLILRNLRKRGILFSLDLLVGHDSDTIESFNETVRFLRQERVPLAFWSIMTPYESTILRKKLDEEGRIFSNDWTKYQGSNCVYQPMRFYPEELEEAFWGIYKQFYSPISIIQRMIPPYSDKKSWMMAFITNVLFATGVRQHKFPVAYC
jgi:radical SAM superfamily enzyme YgiQ (UPF0313 family)